MTYSPLPRADLVPVRRPLPSSAAELAAVLALVRRIRPRPVSVVVGTAMDPVSRANGDRIAQAWSREGGCVLTTVRWPETAASWLRHARRFADPEPDAWVVSAPPAGWIGIGRRLVCSTDWAPGRTVATAGLADPALIAAGGTGTFDGLRGAFSRRRYLGDRPDLARHRKERLTMSTSHTIIDSPLGDLTVVADAGELTGLYFPHHWYRPASDSFGARADHGFEEVSRQLKEYFAGERTRFELPLRADGDEFQRSVWTEIARIPYGTTVTYGEIAAALDDPSLARDVGAAVGRNPLSILIPCHRVVGKNGKLTGYAGGLKRKEFLLELEKPPAGNRGQLW